MAYFAKAYRSSERCSRLVLLAALGLAIFGSQPGLADQIDCEKVRTGTESIRFTVENTAETEVKKPPQRVSYSDVVRNRPEVILLFNTIGQFKLKATLNKALLPLSLEFVGKGITTTYTYDTDISTLALKPGASFTVNVVESAIGGGAGTSAHHMYTITDGGHFDVAGCSFPVVSVHHTAHYTRDNMEWDFVVDSLVSTDLDFTLHLRRQIEAGSSKMESGVYVSVVTDLSTTADMTKDP